MGKLQPHPATPLRGIPCRFAADELVPAAAPPKDNDAYFLAPPYTPIVIAVIEYCVSRVGKKRKLWASAG